MVEAEAPTLTIRSGGWRSGTLIANAFIFLFLAVIFFMEGGALHLSIGLVTIIVSFVQAYMAVKWRSASTVTVSSPVISWKAPGMKEPEAITTEDISALKWNLRSYICFATESGGEFVLNLAFISRKDAVEVRRVLSEVLDFEVPEPSILDGKKR